MKNYLCEITKGLFEGEQFFVQTNDYNEAVKIARGVDKNTHVYKEWFTDYEAEMAGLDTY